MAGPADTFVAYGEAWSTVSNTPFRKHKHWVHEGGTSTPLVAHWPLGIKDPARLEHAPGHRIDIMATAIDVAGTSYATAKTPLEGRSLIPLFGPSPAFVPVLMRELGNSPSGVSEGGA